MTIEELLRRVSASTVSEVVDGIARDPDQAHAFVRTIGPWALGQLARDAGRKAGIVVTGRRANLAPRSGWTLREWKRREGWLREFQRGIGKEYQFNKRVVGAFRGDERLTSESPAFLARLDADDVKHIKALCGRKQLAA